MRKKVLAAAIVMGMGVSAFAQEVVTDSVATDSIATIDNAVATDSVAGTEPTDSVEADSTIAFYLPNDSTATDSSSVAFYEPTDTTVADTVKTCSPAQCQLAQHTANAININYDKAAMIKDNDYIIAVLKEENELA